MTDREIMIHRFSKENIGKSTGVLAKSLGMPRELYEQAVENAMKEEFGEEADSEEKLCDICNKPITYGYMTNDSGSFCVHEGKCFHKYMNKIYGKHKWMALGGGVDDGYGGYYIYADDNIPGGFDGTGIFYTEVEL